MNESERMDRVLCKRRDLWIAVALIGCMGVYVFGIVSSSHDWQAWAFSLLGLTSGSLALFTGRKLGEQRAMRSFAQDQRGVSPVIAVILMVAITVVLAATVFVLVADIGSNVPAPSIIFTSDSVADTLTVAGVSTNSLTWADLAVTGCQAPDNESSVDAGDKLTGCTGDVTVVHRQSNTLLYVAKFD